VSSDTQPADDTQGVAGTARKVSVLTLPTLAVQLPELRGAICKGADPATWFPDAKGRGAEKQAELAKAVCRPCPVRTECLRWALDAREEHGIWGGTTADERKRMRRQPQGLLRETA
jgi:WhiB family transcriptional regulator, redox-sensing transcriptional regulator